MRDGGGESLVRRQRLGGSPGAAFPCAVSTSAGARGAEAGRGRGQELGLSSTNIARLTAVWADDYRQFSKRSLADRDHVYVWADGIHFNVRLEDDRLCTLVIIGSRPDGDEDLVALVDGYRESTESWTSVLRDLKCRGMRTPVVGVGDGALGCWAAVREVWPETREQRDWCHKLATVLDKLPKRLQPKAKRMLHDVMYAETREQAGAAVARIRWYLMGSVARIVGFRGTNSSPLVGDDATRRRDVMSVLAWIVLGLIAGFIGSKLMTNSGRGIVLDIVLGVVGAVVGGVLFRLIGFHGVTGFDLWSLFVAVVGSVVVLGGYHLLGPRRRKAD